MTSAMPPVFTIETVQSQHESRFVRAARRSTEIHHPWIAPPRSSAAFRQHLVRYGRADQQSYVAVAKDSGDLIGCVHLNEIVHGALESAYMAYFVFVPYQGRRLMAPVLAQVIEKAFMQHGLHRLEANIQPANQASKALVRSLGFRLEGFSPRYLFIDGAWRDHERYALTVEDWAGAHRPDGPVPQ